MKLILQPASVKALVRMPRREADGLVGKLRALAADPFAPNPAAKRLSGRDGFRIRHGEWRALYRVDRAGAVVIVDWIGHRREAYR